MIIPSGQFEISSDSSLNRDSIINNPLGFHEIFKSVRTTLRFYNFTGKFLPFSGAVKRVFATVKWYNLCLQIIHTQIVLSPFYFILIKRFFKMFPLRCYVLLLRMWRRRFFRGINAMILMPQIFDVTTNENERYKHNELEYTILNYWLFNICLTSVLPFLLG